MLAVLIVVVLMLMAMATAIAATAALRGSKVFRLKIPMVNDDIYYDYISLTMT